METPDGEKITTLQGEFSIPRGVRFGNRRVSVVATGTTRNPEGACMLIAQVVEHSAPPIRNPSNRARVKEWLTYKPAKIRRVRLDYLREWMDRRVIDFYPVELDGLFFDVEVLRRAMRVVRGLRAAWFVDRADPEKPRAHLVGPGWHVVMMPYRASSVLEIPTPAPAEVFW